MSSNIPRDVEVVALALCDGFAGPVADTVKNCILTKSWDKLAEMHVNPNTYSSAEAYFHAVAPLAFLRKWQDLPTSFDRKAVAIEGFWSAEKQCFRANQRLLPFVYNTYGVEDEAMMRFITCCRKEVEALIGQAPPPNPEGRFGPGATFSDRGGLTTIPDKMQSRPVLTSSAAYFLFPFMGTLWGKACANRSDSITFVPGNRFTTVPKDCEKDRGISIEPSVNLFYQLGFGKALRRELKKRTFHRVDLRHAQTIHRQVACEASISGDFATIDLKQASDTICKTLVKLLLPRQWFEPLNDLRSAFTIIQDGGVEKKVLLEKFSSMGNGFTFELETVLFLAICCAVMRSEGLVPKPGVNVYTFGDDIIVPTSVATKVIAALRLFGLAVNEKKTFLDGPFRESCGGDFFNGVDVRPYFQKKSIYEPQHFIAMANGIRAMAATSSRPSHRWHLVRRAWFRCLDSIPQPIRRCRGPENLGDLVIHDEITTWETRWRSSIRYVRVYRPATFRKVKWQVFDPDVVLAGACYGVGWGNGFVMPRDSVTGYKLGWVPFS